MKITFLLFLSLITSIAVGQTKKDYIYTYAELAVSEMEDSKIPASITLAQGILESRYGTSELSSKSNNHFGIKCHTGWNGKSVKYDDDAKDECFRKYTNAKDSFKDHSEFLSKRGRYSDLFKLSIFDYKGWAKGLRKAGYATNPKYADHLIRIIEEEKLYVFDRMSKREVGPYIVSLRNNVAPNEVFVVKAEPQTNTIATPVDTETPDVIAVQGGPAGALEEVVAQSRDIFSENDIKTVFSFSGDSPAKISAMYDIPLQRLYKYNEWPEYLNEFTWGMKVYLQPKRSKSRDIAHLYHKVKPGETMYQIAHQYGIKTEKLYKWNLLTEEQREQPRAGELISLRKKVNIKPLLRLAGDSFSAEEMEQQGQDDAVETNSEDEDISEVQPVVEKKQVTPQIEPVTKPVTTETKAEPTEDIWGTYPSTNTAEDNTEPNNTQNDTVTPPLEEEQISGRSIIYDPTPPVNQQPVEPYVKPENKVQPRLIPTPQTTTPTPFPTPTITYHTVKKGDTLYGLSKKYGVSVNQIKEWNAIQGSNIKVGQKLVVGK